MKRALLVVVGAVALGILCCTMGQRGLEGTLIFSDDRGVVMRGLDTGESRRLFEWPGVTVGRAPSIVDADIVVSYWDGDATEAVVVYVNVESREVRKVASGAGATAVPSERGIVYYGFHGVDSTFLVLDRQDGSEPQRIDRLDVGLVNVVDWPRRVTQPVDCGRVGLAYTDSGGMLAMVDKSSWRTKWRGDGRYKPVLWCEDRGRLVCVEAADDMMRLVAMRDDGTVVQEWEPRHIVGVAGYEGGRGILVSALRPGGIAEHHDLEMWDWEGEKRHVVARGVYMRGGVMVGSGGVSVDGAR